MKKSIIVKKTHLSNVYSLSVNQKLIGSNMNEHELEKLELLRKIEDNTANTYDSVKLILSIMIIFFFIVLYFLVTG